MKHVERLRQVIRDLHGLDAEHVESIPITETFQGRNVWQGLVDVFSIRGHPQAQRAYAWSYKDDDGTIEHVAVLGVPSIDSAQKAVQAFVMAHIEKQQR